jgi:hypothetical protein
MALSIDRHLPEELLDHILSFVSRTSLTGLCVVSKLFNRLATAHLYSDIVLADDSWYEEGETYIIPVAHFLISSPSHAALVNAVTVPRIWGQIEDNDERCNEHLWPDDRTGEFPKTLKERCAKFGANDEEIEKIYGLVHSGTKDDAVLAFLLFNLPNLRRLNIDLGFCEEHSDFVDLFTLLASRVRVRSIDGSSRLPLDVFVKGSDDKYPNSPAHLAVFFHMSNLRKIYGWQFGDDEGHPDLKNGPFAQLKPRSCPVEFVELRCSKLHPDNFDLLLNAMIPESLKTFIYEIGCTWAWCNIEYSAMMKSLSRFHDTLENLSLCHEECYPHQFGNDAEKPYPCSFTAFRALKRLKVAPVFIWGHKGFTHNAQIQDRAAPSMLWKALPESLEELWIARAEGQTSGHPGHEADDPDVHFISCLLLPALDLVAQHKAEAFPELTRMSIEFPPKKWGLEWLDSLASFCKFAMVKGIHCTVILTEMGHGDGSRERSWGWNEEVEWAVSLQNGEPRKIQIVTAEEEHLGRTLRDLKSSLVLEK